MKITKSVKQVCLLYISTIVGIFLGVLISVLNTRFLEPDSYGDVRYVTNIIAFFSGVFLFGYFVSGSRLLAVTQQRDEVDKIKGVLVTILAGTVVLMMLIMLVCGLFHEYVLHRDYAFLFYISIPVCGSTLLLNYINTSSQGDNSIGMIAAARLLPQLCYLVVGYIIYYFCGATSKIMLLLQNGVYFIVLFVLILKNSLSFHELKIYFKKLNAENKQYGLNVYYGSLVNVSVQYIAGICLGLFSLDNKDVGYYTLALTITMPLMMLPNVVATTYFKRFASLSCIPNKVIWSTYLISIFSFIAFLLLIFPVVGFLYSTSYEAVALYASFLAFGSTFQGLGDIYNRFLGAHGEGKMLRNAAWASGFVAIIGYTIGIYYYGIVAALSTRVASSIVYYGWLLFYYKSFVKRSCS